eukprot:TRINITY_DN869_c0_g1_i6.p1 TRINITY_DN869_c0_g1~~TRINITY_DN869_c0_g1_i6.p1  ORF type:complete len:248 (+),score=23.51 TRINITY_DN869_c0_g1_i6:209-952(+)
MTSGYVHYYLFQNSMSSIPSATRKRLRAQVAKSLPSSEQQPSEQRPSEQGKVSPTDDDLLFKMNGLTLKPEKPLSAGTLDASMSQAADGESTGQALLALTSAFQALPIKQDVAPYLQRNVRSIAAGIAQDRKYSPAEKAPILRSLLSVLQDVQYLPLRVVVAAELLSMGIQTSGELVGRRREVISSIVGRQSILPHGTEVVTLSDAMITRAIENALERVIPEYGQYAGLLPVHVLKRFSAQLRQDQA